MPAPQYLHGDIRPSEIPVATGMAVEAGDIVGVSSNTLVKASGETWDTNLATTQTNFAAKFVGLSTQAKPSTTVARVFGNSQDNIIQVATAGVFEMDCDSATFTIGQFVGPAKDTGNALLNNKVVGVASAALAIGVVHEHQPSVTRVRFRVLSTLIPASK